MTVPCITQGIEILGGIPAFITHLVSVNLVIFPVCYPHGRAIRPKTARRIIPCDTQNAKVLSGIALFARQIVSVKFIVRRRIAHGICYPHSFAIRPNPLRVVIPGSDECVEILRRVAGGELVGDNNGIDPVSASWRCNGDCNSGFHPICQGYLMPGGCGGVRR